MIFKFSGEPRKPEGPQDPRIQKFIATWLQEHLKHGFRNSEDLQKMSEALAEAYDSLGGFSEVGDFFSRHVDWEVFRIQKASLEDLLGSLEDSEGHTVFHDLHKEFQALLNPQRKKSFIDRFADSEVDSEDTERILRSVVLPILSSRAKDPEEILKALGSLEDEEEIQKVTGWSREAIRGTLALTWNPRPLLRRFSDLLSTHVSQRDLIPFLRFLIDFSRQMGGVKHVRNALISGARLLSVLSPRDHLDELITLINEVGDAMETQGLSQRISHLEVIRRILNSGPVTSRVLSLYGTTSRVPQIFTTSRVLPRHVPLELFEELFRILKSDEPLVTDLLKHFTSSKPKYLHVEPLKASLARAHVKSKSSEVQEVLEWFQMLLDDVVADDVELVDWLHSLNAVAQTSSLLEWSQRILEVLKDPKGDWSRIREVHSHLNAFWKDLEDPEAVGPLLQSIDRHNWDPELLTALQQLTENEQSSKQSNVDFLLLVFSRYSDEPQGLVDFLKDLGIDSGRVGWMDVETRFLDELIAVMEVYIQSFLRKIEFSEKKIFYS